VLDESEGLEAEEVHLHEPALLEVVHRELRGHDAGLRVLVEGHEVREGGLADHDARRVEARVPVLVLELLRYLEEVLVLRVVDQGLELGLLREGLGEGHLRVLGHQLRDVVRVLVGYVEGPRHVLEHGLGLERPEGDDLPRAVRSVLGRHVVDDLAPALEAEVDVEVRHRDALGVEEALEEQVVLERIDVRDAQAVGDDGAGARAAARPHGDAVLLGPVDEVPDDEEVARELHLDDDAELVFRALPDLGRDHGIAPLQPLEGEVPHVLLGARVLGREFVVGQHGAGIVDLEVGHLGDLQGVGEGLGQLREEAAISSCVFM
jgi:hypothetical protein